MKTTRFIIITVPPKKVREKIEEFRDRIYRITNSIEALKFPPHVTLRTGVIVPDDTIGEFIPEFENFLDSWYPFLIKTDGILRHTYQANGKTCYFIGYKIYADDNLTGLNKRLLSYSKYRKSEKTSFHPHLSIAYDDLSLDGYKLVNKYIEDNPENIPESFEWICDSVSLYYFAGKRWIPYYVYTNSKMVEVC